MPARAPASMLILQMVMRPSIESARIAEPAYSIDVAGGAIGADVADDVENDVFRRDAVGSSPSTLMRKVFGLGLRQRLRGQHVLDLGGADAEGQRAERAMRGGVRVAADDGHAGLGDAELRADHVHDPLVRDPARRRTRCRSPRSSRAARVDLLARRSDRR